MSRFGLIGKHIDYSFSRSYFSEKFSREGLSHSYENFDMESLDGFQDFIKENRDLKGLNVTIPYKEAIIPYLGQISRVANEIGAVNTIRFLPSGELKGYNTDAFGFRDSLVPWLKPHHKKALILGTGGASKAIEYVLKILEIDYLFVSRSNENKTSLLYEDLNSEIIKEHQIIINSTPLGTFPEVDKAPDIPFHLLSEAHLLYDLVYNPDITRFMSEGKQRGATVVNGLSMLKLQAERSWSIWMLND